MNHSTTSLTLLERAKRGVDSAWRELLLLYTPLGYYWCRQSGLAPRDAEEIWANVLGCVARKLGEFEHNGHPGAFRNWLRTITRHEIIDFHRARGKDMPDQSLIEEIGSEPLRDLDPTAESCILYHRAWEMIRGEFSSDHCEIFRRIVEHGEQPAHVADDFRLKRATVYTIVFRVKTRLREEFEGELD